VRGRGICDVSRTCWDGGTLSSLERIMTCRKRLAEGGKREICAWYGKGRARVRAEEEEAGR